jgi:hypothetical protein
VAAGEVTIATVVCREAVDAELLDLAANATAEILGMPSIIGPRWRMEDVEIVSRLRGRRTTAAPPPEAQTVAATCRLIFTKDRTRNAT